jgi:hypothetical protein
MAVLWLEISNCLLSALEVAFLTLIIAYQSLGESYLESEATPYESVIEDQGQPERFIPLGSSWNSSRPVPQNVATRVALRVLRQAANDYFYYDADRPAIESWMAGDPPPLPFAETMPRAWHIRA